MDLFVYERTYKREIHNYISIKWDVCSTRLNKKKEDKSETARAYVFVQLGLVFEQFNQKYVIDLQYSQFFVVVVVVVVCLIVEHAKCIVAI